MITKPWITEPTFADAKGEYPLMDDIIRGWGWACECLDCRRKVRWTSDDLLETFAEVMAATTADIFGRLKCSACGSKRLYLWAFQSARIDTGHRQNESLEERRLVLLARGEEIVARKKADGAPGPT